MSRAASGADNVTDLFSSTGVAGEEDISIHAADRAKSHRFDGSTRRLVIRVYYADCVREVRTVIAGEQPS
jgi:hypothetical protein